MHHSSNFITVCVVQPNWLVRFPMVKASVRAMDTITAFVATTPLPEFQGLDLQYYSVSGASKRGWTTWLVGAVDPVRVAVIVPIVLDALNFIQAQTLLESFTWSGAHSIASLCVQFCHHQYKAYNGYSFALSDYYDMNITARIDDPNMQLLAENEDPYYFLDRLTMPTMVRFSPIYTLRKG
jgi:PhoPQ-activated pathogenicity-related protein